MKTLTTILYLFILGFTPQVVQAHTYDEPHKLVKPIEWSAFDEPQINKKELEIFEIPLINSARYASRWIEQTYDKSYTNDRYLVPNSNTSNKISLSASIAVGLATVIQTGITIEDDPDLSKDVLTKRCVQLIKGVASVHKSNGGQWGAQRQSSHWATFTARAGWMLWNELDDETRWFVTRMVIYEADKYFVKGYQVPYWNERNSHSWTAVTAWNAMILQLAVAMLPEHAHNNAWKIMATKQIMASFARESDLKRAQPLVDGKAPKDWLNGFNVTEDGEVLNKGKLQIEYMTCIGTLRSQGYFIFSLAQRPVPQSTSYNFDLVYNTFINKTYKAPPYLVPGGTIYKPNQTEIYYPHGTPWKNVRFDIFLIMDAFAEILLETEEERKQAREWMLLRTKKIKEMQSRHKEGNVYAPGEFTYFSAEQLALRILADNYLLQWLKQKNKLSETGNWFEK